MSGPRLRAPARLLPVLVTALVLGVDAWLCIRNPQDLDRLLINVMLAFSAYATLHARLLSLASAGFAAIGAYVSAIVAVRLGIPVWLSIPSGALASGFVALLIGLPVLRLKDVYLAIATLGFGEIVRVSIILLPGLTGGPTGANLSTGFPYEVMKQTNAWALAFTVLALAWLFRATSRAKAGRALRAIRENPDTAATMGIDVVRYKNLAFIASALIAGMAGGFYAHSVGSLDAGDFKFSRAVDILGFAVVGGSGQWFGPLLGAGFLTALPILLRDGLSVLKNFSQLPNILNGLALVLVIIFMPGGLASAFARIRVRVTEGGGSKAPAESEPGPATVADAPADGIKEADPEPRGAVILSLVGVSRHFGGVEALGDISFEIEAGKIHGLIGPNGAGKTTLVNAISGVIPPSSGRIVWEGREIQGRAPHLVAKGGIARTYQNIQLFGEMTALENVVVGRHVHLASSLPSAWLGLPSWTREEAQARAESMALLGRLGLHGIADHLAGTLSYGDQRRVEIARALALHPRLLLLDEPAAGMNEIETARLGDFIATLREHGYTILVIEHHMDLIMKVCDRIVVLNFGRTIAQGRPEEISRDEAVLEAYLGRE